MAGFGDIKKEVIFNEENHTYVDPSDNVLIPSTTTISSLMEVSGDYSKIPNIKWYAHRGTLAHYAMEMYVITGDRAMTIAMAKAKAEELTCTWEDAQPYFESGVKFIAGNAGLKILETEKQFLNNINGMRYAGTIDIVANLADCPTVIDWKTSKDIDKVPYKLQIGAYALKTEATKGYIVKLRDDGKVADIVQVNLDEYKEKWIKILELFYDADLTDDQKRAKTRELIFNKTMLPKTKVDKLVKAKESYDKAKKKLDDLKVNLGNDLGNSSGEYTDDKVKFSMTYIPEGETEKLNTETLIADLGAHVDAVVLKELVLNNTTKKPKASSYRMTVKILTEKKPKEKIEIKPEPKPEMDQVKEPEVKTPEEVPPKPVIYTGDTNNVVATLNARGITDTKLIEVFFITLEGIFGVSRDDSDFDVAGAVDMATEMKLETLKQYAKEYSEGGVVCPKPE